MAWILRIPSHLISQGWCGCRNPNLLHLFVRFFFETNPSKSDPWYFFPIKCLICPKEILSPISWPAVFWVFLSFPTKSIKGNRHSTRKGGRKPEFTTTLGSPPKKTIHQLLGCWGLQGFMCLFCLSQPVAIWPGPFWLKENHHNFLKKKRQNNEAGLL